MRSVTVPELTEDQISSLSPEDRRIVQLVNEGSRCGEIAADMGITVRRVKYRLLEIRQQYTEDDTQYPVCGVCQLRLVRLEGGRMKPGTPADHECLEARARDAVRTGEDSFGERFEGSERSGGILNLSDGARRAFIPWGRHT